MAPPKKNPGENAQQQSLPLQWDSADTPSEAIPNAAADSEQAEAEITEASEAVDSAKNEDSPQASPKKTSKPTAGSNRTSALQKRSAANRRRISLIKAMDGDDFDANGDFHVKVASTGVLGTTGKQTGGGTGDKEMGSSEKAAVEPVAPDFNEGDVTLGQIMQEARGGRNLSLMQVSQATKIPREFLDHLENEAYHELPAPVYCRSYIRQLCRVYGLAVEPCLEEYGRIVDSASRSRSEPVELRLHEEERGLPASTYNPEAMKKYLDTGPGWMSKLPRLAVMGAIALLVLVVATAIILQQVRAWKQRTAEEETTPGTSETVEASPAPSVDFTKFMVPEQLPMREMPIP
jgi:hypothetical protein